MRKHGFEFLLRLTKLRLTPVLLSCLVLPTSGFCASNQQIQDQYQQAENYRVLLECSRRGRIKLFASWGYPDVYGAHSFALRQAAAAGYEECRTKNVNGSRFELRDIYWFDPTPFYKTLPSPKALLICDFGLRAGAKNDTSFEQAKATAMASANEQGLTNCKVEWKNNEYLPEAQFEYVEEVYNIDLLKVTTLQRENPSQCRTGAVNKILVEGQISPDSSFAMSRLLDRLKPCRSADGNILMPVTVSLSSVGGVLNDGYLMGETFREREVTTVVENGQACASSCAVAFLGGKRRIVESDGVIMYHAPYYSGENVYGEGDIDCEVGEDALNELNAYYREMTDSETGDRLFERTMWYCSAEDGWVVKGGSAAELFGIATEK